MTRRPAHVVLSVPAMPDQLGLFLGVRRWLDRHQDLRVRVYPNLNPAQQRSIKCDGVITDENSRPGSIWSTAQVPVVSVSDDPENGYVVGFDDHAVGRLAADHFLDQGYWQFASVTYGSDSYWGIQREQGFAERLREAGRSYASLHLEDVPRDPRSPHVMAHYDTKRLRAVGDFLKAQPTPLAVLAGDDTIAVMVVDACERARLNIPTEVAVLGVNNDPMCQLSGPQLSSIALPSERLGYEAMATIEALLGGTADVPRRTLLPPLGVVVRPSSDALQVRDPIVAKALRYIRDHPRESVGVKELAAFVGMSRRSLELRFREAVGRTPGQEVQRLRERLWRRLLTDTDLSMAEIAERCGFGTPATFATAVRRAEAVSPSEYRRRVQGVNVSNTNQDSQTRKKTGRQNRPR